MVEYIYVWPGFSLCGTDANVKRMQSHKEMSTRVANEVAYAFIPADGECTAFHDTPKGLTEAFACPGNVGVRVRVRVRVRVHVHTVCLTSLDGLTSPALLLIPVPPAFIRIRPSGRMPSGCAIEYI